MKNDSKKVNYTTRPMPSGPGAKQITNDALKSMKGGSDFTSEMPKKHVVKDGCKGEK